MQQSDHLVAFVFSHQTLIIEGIFATILAIMVVWLFANLQDENGQTSTIDAQEIKKMLKKVLDGTSAPAAGPLPTTAAKTGPSTKATPAAQPIPPPAKPAMISLETVSAPSPAATAAAAPPASASVSSPAPIVVTTTVGDAAEALRLKNDIDNRNKKVDELEKSLSQARDDLAKMQDTSKNTGALEELRKQIAVLEGRLKEYAIIEDDIANLSTYKDENQKLKDEIALLKKNGAISNTENVGTAEITSAPLAPAPSWPINEGESKKLLNEFDSLMNTQIKSATEETIDQTNASDGEKLIAEFQNFMKGLN